MHCKNIDYTGSNMPSIIIKNISEQKEIEALLGKSLPSYRQAYSDRTAWLMACISELAYVRFNPIFKDTAKDYFLKKIATLMDENKVQALQRLIDIVGYDEVAERESLEKDADILGLKLIKTFDQNGSQAILLENENYLFLGFRGTETTSIKDVKSDLRAVTMPCETGGKIHIGFNQAFNELAVDIQASIDDDSVSDKPLLITGHSLGGALATVATKKLSHKGGIAACYTFGSPRVGDDEWVSSIKSPVYRLVNAADPVTMMPPGTATINTLAWMSNLIPHFGGRAKSFLLSKFGGYLHAGDMRYLTNCETSDHSKVKLLYAVSFFYRAKAFLTQGIPFSKVPADHSMAIYRNKLKIIACKRN
jgi:predicted lipase